MSSSWIHLSKKITLHKVKKIFLKKAVPIACEANIGLSLRPIHLIFNYFLFIFAAMRSTALSQASQNHLRSALQREFIRRCRNNSSYSLRAFSQFLQIDQSFLSKIFKGKRNITEDFALRLVVKLRLKSTNTFIEENSHLSLQQDELELLSNWSHFAILELSKTKNFKYDPSIIAARLGLHKTEVIAAVERLEKLKFIQLNAKQMIVLTPNTTWTNTKNTTDARRIFQRELLKKSIDAIEHVPFERRENGSLTVAINKNRLPEFKEKLKSVRRDLAEFFQSDGEKNLDEVYQLTLAFFPLTEMSINTTEVDV